VQVPLRNATTAPDELVELLTTILPATEAAPAPAVPQRRHDSARSGMKRLAIPLVVALGALLLGACSWRNDSAATVDGSDISSQDLEADTRALLRQPDFADVYLNTSVNDAAAKADVRLPTAATAVLLNRRISDAIVQRGLDERGITLSDADVAAAQSALEAQLASRRSPRRRARAASRRT